METPTYPSFSRRQLLEATGIAALTAGIPQLAAATQAKFEPTSDYESRQIEGWHVFVSHRLMAERRAIGGEALKLLACKLFLISRTIPAAPLAALRKVPIWLEYEDAGQRAAVFHPDARWLRQHSMNPEKAGCVEIGNAHEFLAWEHDQPWMVLHELSHAYHFHILKFDNVHVKAAYEAAKASGKYESVLHVSGKKEKHYGMTDPQEFFAELSESYWGTNDFFPFVRAELAEYDAASYEVVKRMWTAAPR